MMKLLEYVDQAVAEGATLVYGGKRLDRPGMPLVYDLNDNFFVLKIFFTH